MALFEVVLRQHKHMPDIREVVPEIMSAGTLVSAVCTQSHCLSVSLSLVSLDVLILNQEGILKQIPWF